MELKITPKKKKKEFRKFNLGEEKNSKIKFCDIALKYAYF